MPSVTSNKLLGYSTYPRLHEASSGQSCKGRALSRLEPFLWYATLVPSRRLLTKGQN